MPPAAPLTTTAITAGAETSGDTVGRALGGLANQIMESVNGVRVNKKTALDISRRGKEMANAIVVIMEEFPMMSEWSRTAMFEEFHRALLELLEALKSEGEKGYLTQLLHQQSNKVYLDELSAKMTDTYNTLMVQLRLHASKMATALSLDLEAMAAKHQAALDSLGDIPVPAITFIPSKPQLYFGRVSETQAVVDAVTVHATGRVTILGGPGMGKTTLALLALHHPSVAKRFGKRRFFVACDAAEGKPSCLATIAEALGVLATDPKSMQLEITETLGAEPSIIVLDNFESAWEPHGQRTDAERVLQCLDAVPNLSLICTLRGTERPHGVQWTRPFIPPLAPLSDAAARQTFASIADTPESDPCVAQLLDFLDNVPLAIVLMANLAQSESTQALLTRWASLRTSMLSRAEGRHRLTSLDVSINLSVQSPRMQVFPAAQALLSAISLLPHGAVVSDLLSWAPKSSAQAIAALLRSSLATRGADQRIFVLAPIRSFMISHYPPAKEDIAPLYAHYFRLAELVRQSILFTFDAEVLSAVGPELANLDTVIRYALQHSPDAEYSAIKAVICLALLYNETSLGPGPELLATALATARARNFEDLCADLQLQSAVLAYNGAISGDPETLFRQARDAYERVGNEEGILDARIAVIWTLEPAEGIREARLLYEMSRARGDLRRMSRSASRLAQALSRDGQLSEAIAQYEHAIALSEQAGSPGAPNRITGYLKFQLGEEYKNAGNFAMAVRMCSEALVIFESTRLAFGATQALMRLAEIHLDQRNPLEAIQCASRALAMKAANFRSHLYCLMDLVQAHAMAGQIDAAAAAMETLGQSNNSEGFSAFELGYIRYSRALLAKASGDAEGARALLDVARDTLRTRDLVEIPEVSTTVVAQCLGALGEIHGEQGRPEEAVVLFCGAAILFRSINQMLGTVQCLVLLAEVVDDDDAEVLIDAVLLPIRRMDLHYDLAKALLRLAGIAQTRGQHELARHRATSALAHFGDVKDERRVRIAQGISLRE